MSNLIGTKFKIGSTEYIVDSVQEFDKDLTAIISELEKTGKDAAFYIASKVLKSGKKSKQGGASYRFSKSGNFTRAM